MSEGIFRRCITKIDVYRLLMIEFLNIQSAFEHYKRVLGGNGPVETRAKYHDDRLYVEHYHAYTGAGKWKRPRNSGRFDVSDGYVRRAD